MSDEQKTERGRVVASYLVRVTLRERPELPLDQWVGADGAEDPTPTIAYIESLIAQALYERLPYFTDDCIRVTAERTDR